MKYLRNLAVAFSIFLASYMPLKSQTISGQITDLLTKQGIPNLEVTVDNKKTYTDDSGHYSLDLSVDVKDETNLPKKTELYQNYPNPFNPRTTITYSLDKTSNVNLVVYNLLGEEVKTLVNGQQEPRTYEVVLDGTNESGKKLANGIYFYRLSADDFSKTGKMILLDGINTSDVGSSKNLESRVSESGRLNKTLNKILISNFSVRDETTNEIGDYFDYSEDLWMISDREKNVVMIPNLQWNSTVYPNLLNFVKYMTVSDGTNGNTTLIKWTSLPIQDFYNRDGAPNEDYILANEVAVGDYADTSGVGWENSTSFVYQDSLLPAINLSEEVNTNPSIGNDMDYTTTHSNVIFDKWNGPPWEPRHTTVFIDNNIPTYEGVLTEHIHERGHVIFSSARESSDSTHVMNRGMEISSDEGKAVRIIYELPNFQDMGHYLED